MNKIQEQVIDIVRKNCGEYEITPATNLKNDLGLNSLDLVELMFDVESDFKIIFNEEDYAKINTVNDIVLAVESSLKK